MGPSLIIGVAGGSLVTLLLATILRPRGSVPPREVERLRIRLAHAEADAQAWEWQYRNECAQHAETGLELSRLQRELDAERDYAAAWDAATDALLDLGEIDDDVS